MKVRITKNCRWSFRGSVCSLTKGQIVDHKLAGEMVDAGYAEPIDGVLGDQNSVEKEKSMNPVKEDKSINPSDEDKSVDVITESVVSSDSGDTADVESDGEPSQEEKKDEEESKQRKSDSKRRGKNK